MKVLPGLIFSIIGAACAGAQAAIAAPIDPQRTAETLALYNELNALAEHDGFAFGNQGDHHSGVNWADAPNDNAVPDSDIHGLTGADAGISGYNAAWLFDRYNNADPDAFKALGEEVRAAYARGQIVTFHWPMTNPETGTDDANCPGCHDLIDTVLSPNLEGQTGSNYDTWRRWMDVFADFLTNEAYFYKGNVRTPIPVLFRPWHEMNQGGGGNGNGRWYQVPNNSVAQYDALWQQTVKHLRDTRGIHQLLYVYAPSLNAIACNGCDAKAQYIADYPGDDWVDVLGGDCYFTLDANDTRFANLTSGITIIADTAMTRGKIPALSETGHDEGLQHFDGDDFWRVKWLTRVRNAVPAKLKRLAYVMTWSNGGTLGAPKFFVPYVGGRGAEDFQRFRTDPQTLFADDLLRMFPAQ